MRKMRDSSKQEQEDPVQLAGRGEVAPEGLLQDHPRPRVAAGALKLLDHEPEERWRDGEVVGGVLRRAELAVQRLERRRIRVVAVDVAQEAGELGRRGARGINSVVAQGLCGVFTQLLHLPATLGDPDDGYVQHAPVDEAHQSGERRAWPGHRSPRR